MLRTSARNYATEFATGQIAYIRKTLGIGLPFVWSVYTSSCLSAAVLNTKERNFLSVACFLNSNPL